MKQKITILLFVLSFTLSYGQTIVGQWDFDDAGDYLDATVAIAPSGADSLVNTYTLLMDIKINFSETRASLMQTDKTNNSGNDGDLFVVSNKKMGNSGIGYSGEIFDADTWYRW